MNSGRETLRRTKALRVATDSVTAPTEEDVSVVVEAPLTIDIDGVDRYTVVCTPDHWEALAVGFLFTEGVIDGLEGVSVKPCEEQDRVVRVKLVGRVPQIGEQGRSMLIISSCGACGDEDIEQRISALPRVGDTLRMGRGALRAVNSTLRENQPLFEGCGGTHAAAIFSGEGELLACAEDVGRHNALDKAIGHCLLASTPTAGCIAVLSGRASLELTSKCARAGIELVSAISAPTSLALEVAERCNITLCAFVRETRATVFTHPRRLV